MRLHSSPRSLLRSGLPGRWDAFRRFTFVCVCVIPIVVFAQQPGFTWVNGAGGPTEDHGWSVAVDLATNVLVAGHFTGPASFGRTNLDQSAMLDLFLAKYDGAGRLLWVQRAGGPGEDDARGVAADPEGNSYFTGSVSSPADFGPLTVHGQGTTDIFLAKYDPAGIPIWIRVAGGPGNNEGRSVAVGADRSILVTGYFSGTANFAATHVPSAGLADVFLAKYGSEGNLLWVRSAGGANSDEAFAVALDREGNSLVTGSFQGIARFATNTLTSAGQGDVFVAKYNPLGELLWARPAGSDHPFTADAGHGIAADFAGNIYVTGAFHRPAAFDGVTLPHEGSGDIFVARCNPSGTVNWARRFGSQGPDQGHCIQTDANGDVYVTGFFFDTVAFGSFTLNSPNHADVFVAKLDGAGNVLWALQPGGGAYKSGNGLALSPANTSFITGFFRGTTAFGSFTLTNNFLSNRDAFVARIDGPPAMPRLTLERTDDRIVLSWPAAPAAFQLETSRQLGLGANWAPFASATGVANGRRQATNAGTGAREFFRLRAR